MVRCLTLDASFFHYSMMDSTYYQKLHVKHKQNAYRTLSIDSNNRPYLVQRFLSEFHCLSQNTFSYCILALGLGDFRDCENNRDVVFIIVMLMSTLHNRDCAIQLRFVL